MARAEAAVNAIKNGEMVVVVDDHDRENEGDLIMAASEATPEQVAFMIRHTSGILCTPITKADAKRLKLDPMVAENDSAHTTAFTVSIDYAHGTTTGISADDRCNTVRALTNPNVNAEDFVRPGHIFPLIAREGGVLMRSGHTEAGVDLARLADLPPVALISELVNDNGTVQKGSEVSDFANKHGFVLVSVADLIAYRQRREKLVSRIASFPVQTSIGQIQGYSFSTPFESVEHLALVYGDISSGENILTRLHKEQILHDVFMGGREIETSLEKIKENGSGILIYLREGASGVPASALFSSIKEDHASQQSRDEEWRDVGLGAQILNDLNINSIRLLASKERVYVGLKGFGINITETVSS